MTSVVGRDLNVVVNVPAPFFSVDRTYPLNEDVLLLQTFRDIFKDVVVVSI